MKTQPLSVAFVGAFAVALLIGGLFAGVFDEHNQTIDSFTKDLKLTDEQLKEIEQMESQIQRQLDDMKQAMQSNIDANNVSKDKGMAMYKQSTKMLLSLQHKVALIGRVLDDDQRKIFYERYRDYNDMKSKKQAIKAKHNKTMNPVKEELAKTDSSDKATRKKLVKQLLKMRDAMIHELSLLIDDKKERKAFVKAEQEKPMSFEPEPVVEAGSLSGALEGFELSKQQKTDIDSIWKKSLDDIVAMIVEAEREYDSGEKDLENTGLKVMEKVFRLNMGILEELTNIVGSKEQAELLLQAMAPAMQQALKENDTIKSFMERMQKLDREAQKNTNK